MKKLGVLMRELGFNPQASKGAQEAFIKNMIREAYGIDMPTPTERKTAQSGPAPKTNEQLSFNLRDLVVVDDAPPRKKRAGGGYR